MVFSRLGVYSGLSLQKLAHAIYATEMLFSYKNYIFAQNIDRGNTFEPPR